MTQVGHSSAFKALLAPPSTPLRDAASARHRHVVRGRTVVDGIYDGDIERVRDRHKDCPTLRALAAHPRTSFSGTALHNAIGIYQLCTRNPGVLDSELTVTHRRAVLPFSAEVQDQLLIRAVPGGWTTDRLRQAARAVEPRGGKGGRPRLPQAMKTLTRLDRFVRGAALGGSWALPAGRRACGIAARDGRATRTAATRDQTLPRRRGGRRGRGLRGGW